MTRLLFQLGLRSSGRTPGPVAVRLISISGPSWRYPPGWVGEVYHTLEGRRSANPLRSVNRVTKPHGGVAMDLDLNRYDGRTRLHCPFEDEHERVAGHLFFQSTW